VKAKELEQLGFEINLVTAEESGSKPFTYYTLDIGSFCLITNEKEPYFVEIFNEDDFRFNDIKELKSLIDILNGNRN
tara:strand:+ start:820 stop:1050 length:231 start_codon:yes stop_codon:yes gene_type:complete